jgi:hypothetical protein
MRTVYFALVALSANLAVELAIALFAHDLDGDRLVVVAEETRERRLCDRRTTRQSRGGRCK